MSPRDYWAKFRDRTAGYRNLAIAVTVLVVAAASLYYGVLPDINVHLTNPNVVALDLGWDAELATEATKSVIDAGDIETFRIVGAAQDNANKRVVFWDATRAVNGSDIPVINAPPPEFVERFIAAEGYDPRDAVDAELDTIRQLIGDCVGAGAKQAIDYAQYVDVYLHGADITPRPSYLAYHYAVGRNAPECGNGRLNRGRDPWSGSVGSWQAEALKKYGWIPQDTPGLKPYSSSVIKRWAVRMPAQKYLDLGKHHRVKTIALARTPEDVRDAICNGYPVTIASDWGGMMRPPVKYGCLVNRLVAKWLHQMAIVGYDGTGPVPLWYVLNSWGPKAHGTPPDDAPAGGFWIERRDMAYIVAQGDSWILSQVEGFPSNDWIIIRGDDHGGDRADAGIEGLHRHREQRGDDQRWAVADPRQPRADRRIRVVDSTAVRWGAGK